MPIYTVYSNEVLANIAIESSSIMRVSSGGTAVLTGVYGGNMYVSNGGYASQTTIHSGNMFISNGANADTTTIHSGGVMYVNSGGRADITTVNSGGQLLISSSGSSMEVTTLSGGYVQNYGTINRFIFESINSYHGTIGTVDDLSFYVFSGDRNNKTAMLTDINQFQQSQTYSITVRTEDVFYNTGTWLLASGLTSTFNKTLTIYSHLGETLGTISVNAPEAVTSFGTYTLTQSNGKLTLDYTRVGGNNPLEPSVISFVGDTKTPVQQTVLTVTTTSGNPLYYNTVSSHFTGEWTVYSEPLEITENATYYFKTQDEKGKVYTRNITFANIDHTPPTTPTVKASTTKPTNEDVTVKATFSKDTALKEYSLDGENWEEYTSNGVSVSENQTLYFRATDIAGNVSDVKSYDVTNIDKTPPPAPVAESTPTAETNLLVTVTATFDDDCATCQYSLDGTKWLTYNANKGVVVGQNSTIYFRGIDAAGNISDVTEHDVTNIIDGPNDNWTDLKENGDASVEYVQLGNIDSTTPVEHTDKLGPQDSVDYFAFTLVDPAKLVFSVEADIAATLAVYSLKSTTKSNVTTYSLKSISSKSISAGKTTQSKPILLDKGTYYIGLKSANKKADWGIYTLSTNLDQSVFYTQGDNSDDWTTMATDGAAGLARTLGVLDGNSDVLIENDWVGFGDTVDYASFTLNSAAALTFTATADVSKAAKFSVYSPTSKSGKYSLKSLGSATPTYNKKTTETTATTKTLMLEAGTYYVAMQSTTAKNGGGTEYSVSLGTSVFYTEGNTVDDNDWQDENLASIDATTGTFDDWVGFGDATDYRAIDFAATGGFYQFDLSGVENSVKLTVYSVTAKGKLKTVKSVTATAKKPSATTGILELAEGTTYILGVTATDAKKAKNSAYTVEMAELGVFTGTNNNTWANATELAPGGDFTGCLAKKNGDSVDYFDVSALGALTLSAEAGAVKVSFYNENHKAVKTNFIYANNAVGNASSLKLTDGNAKTDSIAIGDLLDTVKYLKIEGASSGVNNYCIAG